MTARPLQNFVLASGSPRRRELLERLGLRFTVHPPNVDETRLENEAPAHYVERLARLKAQAVEGELVLAADTAVAVAAEVLGKPSDRAEARRMLSLLSGREHSVFTAVATARHCRVVETRVWFKALRPPEIDWYVATPEPYDKAGGYAIQGLAAAFIARVEGSPTNVIGLPLPETVELLTEAGYLLPW